MNHPDHHNDSYEDLTREDVLELPANHSLEEWGAEIFARLDISEWDLLLAESQNA